MKRFVLGLAGLMVLASIVSAAASTDEVAKETVWVMTYSGGGG